MQINKLMQPEGTSLCGQTIVAMLGKISLQKAIEIVGTAGSTNTKQIIRALRQLNIKVNSERLLCITQSRQKSKYCIVHLGFGKSRKKHWTLWHGEEECFYDPAFMSKIKEEFYRNNGAKILSYLPIEENE